MKVESVLIKSFSYVTHCYRMCWVVMMHLNLFIWNGETCKTRKRQTSWSDDLQCIQLSAFYLLDRVYAYNCNQQHYRKRKFQFEENFHAAHSILGCIDDERSDRCNECYRLELEEVSAITWISGYKGSTMSIDYNRCNPHCIHWCITQTLWINEMEFFN